MVRPRRGAGQLGCLVMLMLIAAVVYFGLNIGQVFWNYYQLEDRMRTEARYASKRTDGVIRRRIEAFADSLGMPESARNVHVRRTEHAIFIWSDYSEHIELPGYVREVHFNPQATGAF